MWNKTETKHWNNSKNKPLRTPVVQLYQSYNTLSIPKLYHLQLLCLVFKYFNHNKNCQLFLQTFYSNTKIHTYNTRSANDLHLSCVDSLRGVRCVKFKASLLWYNLPTQLKEINNLSIFKNSWLIFFYLKIHLTKRQIITIYHLTLSYI